MVLMQQISGGLGMTVLIYSQSRPLRQALQSSLHAMGCKAVVSASTIDEARTILAVQHVEVALVTDAATVNDLQTIHSGLPVVCLTNDDVQPEIPSLKKPFRMQELEACLLTTVREHVEQQPAAMAL